MALAAAYAAGVALETYWLSIPTMARTHGLLNGVGFTLCALLAHTLNPAARESGPGPLDRGCSAGH
jgi:hypothetical protein